ncbi:hypothetical protein V6N12_002916 [Hibiscus sabdariffa]|uniref:Myb/SANT-like domain-containing protein n=1 Tax=Hibiscus sabdariffa TaxID=183260 RepID=A0ABR2EAD1_9ROSI
MRRNRISIINSLVLVSIVGASSNLEMLELGKQVHGLAIRLGTILMLHVEASGEKVKASWDTRTKMIFCDLCIKEILDGKAYTQRQLKNRWDLLKREWKIWKKLKENDTGLGWNYTERTIDASEEWWKSSRGIVATGDKAWAPSSGILPSDFVEHDGKEALDEIEEENAIGSDGNNESPRIQFEPIEQMQQNQKSIDVGSSHFKGGKRNL